jgi:hypothetical protein
LNDAILGKIPTTSHTTTHTASGFGFTAICEKRQGREAPGLENPIKKFF